MLMKRSYQESSVVMIASPFQLRIHPAQINEMRVIVYGRNSSILVLIPETNRRSLVDVFFTF